MPEYLRPEAMPLPTANLDAAQQAALEKMLGMLHTAIARAVSHPPNEPVGPIFKVSLDRASRVVMLSGERGTGKTTVLLSLIEECRKARQPRKGIAMPAAV